MSLEAVRAITEAERRARARVDEAHWEAECLLAEAERDGRALLRETEAQAQEETSQMLAKAVRAAEMEAERIRTEGARACDALRARAEHRMERAVQWIVGKAVQV